MDGAPSTLRLILWPSLITLVISVARFVAEVNGTVNAVSGGAGTLLGITWCIFAFGAWFGWRLAKAGHGPRVRFAFVWALLAFAAIVAAVAHGFRPLVGADRSEQTYAALRQAVLIADAVAIAAAVAMAFVWRRLAWTMLAYAIPARLTVVALTWLAKSRGWDTHYQKFGPSGIESDMTDTMISASVAQLGGWVPLTVVGGVLAGSLFGRARRGQEQQTIHG
jgi:hypothetical protein